MFRFPAFANTYVLPQKNGGGVPPQLEKAGRAGLDAD